MGDKEGSLDPEAAMSSMSLPLLWQEPVIST
jgi:hypothetical protein